MSFTDDFNRADGALGNGWVINTGAASIVSSNAYSEGYTLAVNTNTNGTTYQEATVTSINNTTGASISCPVVKAMSGGNHWFNGNIYLFQGSWYYVIEYNDNGTGEVASASTGSAPTGTVVTRLVYDNGHLSFYVNGTLMVEGDSARNQAYTLSGIRFPYYGPDTVSLFEAEDSEPQPYLTIEPEQVWFANPIIFLQATLHNATWEANAHLGNGLVADKGFISATHDETSTIAAFEWAALGNQGTVTVTDPVTGATGTFLSTLYPPQDSGQSYPLTENGANVLNNANVSCEDAAVLTTCDEVETGSGVTILKALDAILEQLGGFYNQVGPDIGAVSLPSLIYELAKKVGVAGYWTTEEVLTLLGGTPAIYSNADIITAIGNLSPGDNQDVLDALAAYFGENPPTIAQIGTMVSNLATIAGYDLGDVLDAIAAIPTTDLSGVMDKLDAIQPSNTDTLTSIQAAIVPSSAIQAIVDAGALAVAGEAGATIAAVLDAISALSDLVEAQTPVGPPVWPGLAGVTLGDAAQLVDQTYLVEDMQGVIVSITTPPTRTGLRQIGGALYDYGVGELAFETDNGDLEPWQYLGFRSAIFTPKTMARAAGVRFRVLAGAAGTVTPWTSS